MTRIPLNPRSKALEDFLTAEESAGQKKRTWPASVCQDPQDNALWNVRGIDGFVVFYPGVPSRRIAQQAYEAINEHFDHGAAPAREPYVRRTTGDA